nr:propionyl coenzyme A carboxylase alpha chain [Hymenolepis microstoma]
MIGTIVSAVYLACWLTRLSPMLRILPRRFHLLSRNLSNIIPKNFYWNDRYDPDESRFRKVLIANRGEIACRIIRTCQRLGIKTVAVFSEADSSAHFVQLADESICIGPAPAAHSYLNMDAILSAVAQTGADAVHPGYGFLSENSKFADRLSLIGVTYIGPNAKSMRLLGDKIESKRIVNSTGIKCIPGHDGEVCDNSEAFKIADDIGYPIMIKASAGGGGKGMRIVRDSSELLEALNLSKHEAKSCFGDDRVLFERALQSFRHIEVQVLCDRHGNALHLYPRECSIQRRNQKLIEEAPGALFSSCPSICKKICGAALLIAKSAGYDSAGTVEFLLDAENPQNFYFLEVNTRLQVEHTITECITGIDIVHQMLRIAKGHRLLYKQTENDIPCRGWAMECRVCAEDPYRALGTPTLGQLTTYKEPSNLPGIRCDSSVSEGSNLSVFYDPLVSKLIAYGCDRDAVLKSMARALDSFVIRGVRTNIPLLRDVILDPGFVSGIYTIKHLDVIYPSGFHGVKLSRQELNLMTSTGAVVYLKALLRNFSVSRRPINETIKLNITVESKFSSMPDNVTKINVTPRDGYFEVKGPSLPSTLRIPDNFSLSDNLIQSETNGPIFQLCERNFLGDVCLQYRGEVYWLRVRSEKAFQALNTIGIKSLKVTDKRWFEDSSIGGGCLITIRAPLPGLVTSICVSTGQAVVEGDEVCVLEAMKMRNSLRAPQSGTVKSVRMKEGQTVSEGDIILEMER